MSLRIWLMTAAALPLAGCFDDTASLRLGGNDHALTLQARQPYFWSQTVELESVMSRQPDCHRRSRLDRVTLGEVSVDVYRPEAGEFAEPILILKQGANFYAVSTANCELQKFTAPPAKPGMRLGTFLREGEKKLQYAPAPQTPAPAAAASAPAAAPAIPPPAQPQ